MDGVLSDGQWHDREQVIQIATDTVPVVRAWAAAERNRRRSSASPVRTRGDASDARRVGARRVVCRVLRAAVATGLYERRGDLIRARPRRAAAENA
jgi:hypothetical protein